MPAACYRNRLVREWDGRDAEILAHREELASDAAYGRAREDPEMSSVYFGQGRGARPPPFAPPSDVLREMCDDAERIIRELRDRFGDRPI